MAETLKSKESENKYPVMSRCAACKKIMGIAFMGPNEGEFSDGFCPECFEKEAEKIREFKEKRKEKK
jgi:hypothetical protein